MTVAWAVRRALLTRLNRISSELAQRQPDDIHAVATRALEQARAALTAHPAN